MNEAPLLIVAGEASGDLHAARLFAHLKQLRPETSAFGLGGEELESAGVELIANSAEISVLGITEVLGILRRAREIYRQLLAEVDRRGCRAAILVDFPDFNLRLAEKLKRRGLEVVYYVSPQVWAWRRRRVRTIARVVDRMLVLFKFEVEFYRQHGIEAVCVGHPLVDEVPELPQVWDRPTAGEPVSPAKPFHIALLPGSRRSEVERLLPIQLGAARLISQTVSTRFSLLRASSIEAETLVEPIRRSGLDVEVVSRGRFDVLADSHLAICAAGTATLEVGLVGTPMVIVHRIAVTSYYLGRLLVRLRFAGLVNLLLDYEAVPECMQWRARASTIAETAVALLQDRDAIDAMRESLRTLRERIGPAGASRRAAEEVVQVLDRL